MGTGITLLGEAAELDSSRTGTIMIFAIAGIIVLLVLAAQFESFVSAIIIMLTVPFGLAAAMLAITISGGTLNYYSQIGLVMLIGVMAQERHSDRRVCQPASRTGGRISTVPSVTPCGCV